MMGKLQNPNYFWVLAAAIVPVAVAETALAQNQPELNGTNDTSELSHSFSSGDASRRQSLSARHTTPLRANSPTLSLPPIPFGKASPTTPLGSGNNYPAIHYPLPTTHHLTSLSNAIAQTETSPIEIIGIQLEETETGLQVMLETADGELTPSTPSVSGNALITEIPNAVLVQEEFLEFEPAEGIALVQVTELPGNRVQVVVTGLETAPTVESSTTATKLTLSILPGTPQVGEAADPLRVVVTGEQEDGSRYFEPTATTGTRTDTPLRDIPQSIQVIPREVLEDQQVIRLDEALRNVSGVTFGSTDAGRGLQFNIRGFNSAPILRNGFRQIGPRQASSRRSFPEVANLEQVEVLKGPAAVLYGEVEPGGVINLVTKRPLSEPYYQFQTQIGSRELLRPSIDLSGPLTDDGRLLYRLNAVYQSRDEIQNYDSDIRRSFISPVLTWQISDRTDLTIELEYLEDERPAFYGLPAFGDGIADIPPDQISNEPDDVMKQEFFNIGYDFEHRFSDNWRIRNGFRYVREDSALEAAVPIDLDEETGLLLRNFSLQDAETEVFALQTNIVGEFTTGSIEHTLLFGIDLDRTHLRGSTTVDVFNPLLLDIFDPVYEAVPRPSNFEELPLLLDENTRTDQLGIYIQDQISLLDNLILLAGLRYDTVEQRRTGRPTLFNPDGTDEIQNDDAFSPRIGIVYQPIEEISLYANYSRSFTPNTGTSFEGDLFEPEEGEGYEVGIKAELLDGRLAATLSYFDITKQNVVTADPEIIGASVITGEQRSRGVELDIIGEILPGWNVIASYAFIDAEIIEDNTFEVGNRLIGVPEHSASLWTTYEIQSGDLQGLGLGLGFDFVGDREGDLENSFQLDSYFVTNAAIFYGRDNWRAALNFRNLFDTDYMVGGINNRFRSNEPGEPFTVVGSISVQF